MRRPVALPAHASPPPTAYAPATGTLTPSASPTIPPVAVANVAHATMVVIVAVGMDSDARCCFANGAAGPVPDPPPIGAPLTRRLPSLATVILMRVASGATRTR